MVDIKMIALELYLSQTINTAVSRELFNDVVEIPRLALGISHRDFPNLQNQASHA